MLESDRRRARSAQKTEALQEASQKLAEARLRPGDRAGAVGSRPATASRRSDDEVVEEADYEVIDEEDERRERSRDRDQRRRREDA